MQFSRTLVVHGPYYFAILPNFTLSLWIRYGGLLLCSLILPFILPTIKSFYSVQFISFHVRHFVDKHFNLTLWLSRKAIISNIGIFELFHSSLTLFFTIPIFSVPLLQWFHLDWWLHFTILIFNCDFDWWVYLRKNSFQQFTFFLLKLIFSKAKLPFHNSPKAALLFTKFPFAFLQNLIHESVLFSPLRIASNGLTHLSFHSQVLFILTYFLFAHTKPISIYSLFPILLISICIFLKF